jgi:uncharacterized protein DUF3485
MSRLLPILVVAPLLLGYGLIEGRWTNRWNPPAALQAAADRLQGFPMALGEWSGQAVELSERELAVGQIKGYAYRRYVHPPTGKVIAVLLVCGRPGPISAHTPDVCFAGSGYGMIAEPVRLATSAGPADPAGELWTANFCKEDGPLPDPLFVAWGWNVTGGWEAPANPRLRFARYPMLFKLYVVQHLASLSEPDAKETYQEFMSLLLPELQRRLFSPPL